jgi:Protein of unknown function (DUF433)
MPLAIVAEPAPLETDTDGVVRVGKTRVTLDTVVSVFKQGTTAEEIVYRYPSMYTQRSLFILSISKRSKRI